MATMNHPTCEYEIAFNDPDPQSDLCGKPASWSVDIGGGCSYFCDGCRREILFQHGLDGTDEPAPTFHRLLPPNAAAQRAVNLALFAAGVLDASGFAAAARAFGLLNNSHGVAR